MKKIGNQKVTRKSVARYLLLPGFSKEFRRLGHSLGHFAYILALIFARAGIFKTNHPYINPANIGRFGVGDVFGAAGQAVKLDRKHFPQVAIYLATITLVVLMSVQVTLSVVTIGVGEARAAAAPLFTCAAPDCNPAEDMALDFLGNIFGEYDFITDGNAGARTPSSVHLGLWTLLAYYSNALLIVATFIVLYYVISAVGETAVYGTPFGRRFNSVWAPLRLVTALGLLVPLPMAGLGGPGVGLNSGQYIVLFAAKSGSNLASNGLSIFTDAVSDANYAQSFIAQPSMPNITSIVQGTFAWALCAAAVDKAGVSETIDLVDSTMSSGRDSFALNGTDYLNFWVKSPNPDEGWVEIGGPGDGGQVGSAGAGSLALSAPTPPTGAAVINHYESNFGSGAGTNVKVGDIVVAMGPPGHPEYCGVMTMPQNMMADENEGPNLQDPTAGPVAGKYDFAREVRELYMDIPLQLWTGGPAPGVLDVADDISCMMMSQGCTPATFGNPALLPVLDVPSNWVTFARNQVIPVLSDPGRRDAYAIDNAIQMNNGFVANKGWASAALYFNEIMRANQVLQHAAESVPGFSDAPIPLEHYQQENPTMAEGVTSGSGMQGANGVDMDLIPGTVQLGKGAGNPNSQIKQFTSSSSVQENSSNIEASFDYEIGNVIGTGMSWFNKAPTIEKQSQAGESSGAGGGCSSEGFDFGNCIRSIVGIQGFYDLEASDPRTENPLVLMQNIGSQLVNSSLVIGGVAVVSGIFSPSVGNALFALAGVGFGVGAFLNYVLPLMPFVYFFFGVVQWGFSVFEAVVAAPLWALSHLRIDGEGLPGPAAMNGYYLIFEIFLRPMLLLFGLIASSLCFTAGAYMLHQTWGVTTQAILGDDATGFIDGFVMVMLYTLVTYILANACFQMITKVPQAILRWMGQGGATPLSDMFGDVGSTMRMGGMGIGGAMGGLGQSMGGAASAGGRSAKGRVQQWRQNRKGKTG